MLLEAPPSRYRVVERDGRLTVIDTLGDGAPRAARDLIARDGEARRPDPPAEAATPTLIHTLPRRRPVPSIGPPATRPRPSGARQGNTSPDALPPGRRMIELERATSSAGRSPLRPPAQPPGLLRTIAATVAGDARDDAGRLLLDTAPWYDAKAPRTIALDAGAETRLGAAVAAAAIGAFLALFLVVMGESIGWIIAVIGVVAIGQAKPVVTRWLDRLQ